VQLAERIHLVGSGAFGFDLSDPYDCHVYLLDGSSELALIDLGAGMGTEQIVANVERAGFDPARITRLLCTHSTMPEEPLTCAACFRAPRLRSRTRPPR
jgi:hydroxyacylglutathione hydrolase